MSAITPNAASGRRDKLSVAIVWAQLFMREAQREIDGKSHMVPRTTSQLRAALDALTSPTVDEDDPTCKCSHTRFDHKDPTGGQCLVPGCLCEVFEEAKDGL